MVAGRRSRKHSKKSGPLLVDTLLSRRIAARAMQALASYQCRPVATFRHIAAVRTQTMSMNIACVGHANMRLSLTQVYLSALNGAIPCLMSKTLVQRSVTQELIRLVPFWGSYSVCVWVGVWLQCRLPTKKRRSAHEELTSIPRRRITTSLRKAN